MSNDRISVIQAAQQVGLDKRTAFKILKRLGIQTLLERGSDSDHRGQAIAYITDDDFEMLQEHVASRNISSSTSESDAIDGDFVAIESGVFYLIQLEPKHDPGRFKVGFAVSIAERLRAHRCSAPFANVVKTWPCRRLWERTAIDGVTAGCEKLHTEVFRTDDLNTVIMRCDQFFAFMPKVISNELTVDDWDAEQDMESDRELADELPLS